MCLKIPHPPLTTLSIHNIAWDKFCSFFLNIVKGEEEEKQKIVQIAVFPIIFVTDCLKNSQKSQMWVFTVGCFEWLWSHEITLDVTLV